MLATWVKKLYSSILVTSWVIFPASFWRHFSLWFIAVNNYFRITLFLEDRTKRFFFDILDNKIKIKLTGISGKVETDEARWEREMVSVSDWSNSHARVHCDCHPYNLLVVLVKKTWLRKNHCDENCTCNSARNSLFKLVFKHFACWSNFI